MTNTKVEVEVEVEVQDKMDAVNKRLFGTASPTVMLKRFKRCVVLDKRSGLFVISASSMSSSASKEKLFEYVHFLIKQHPEFRMIRKSKVVIKPSGKRSYVASCNMSIDFW